MWDAENRLVEVRPTTPVSGDKKVEFKYDYLGRRVLKRVLVWDPTLNSGNGGWSGSPGLGAYARRFVWSGWLMLLEFQGETGFQPVRKYTWGLDLAGQMGSAGVSPASSAGPELARRGGSPASLESAGGIGGLLAVQAPAAGPGGGDLNAVYTYDANGNVGQLVAWATGFGGAQGDEWHVDRLVAHYEYDPYGGVTAQSGTYATANPVRFSTKYWDDETGSPQRISPKADLGYWGYRYYSPALGRWVSRDPIEVNGGINIYGCSGNNVVDRVDPLGLAWLVNENASDQSEPVCCKYRTSQGASSGGTGGMGGHTTSSTSFETQRCCKKTNDPMSCCSCGYDSTSYGSAAISWRSKRLVDARWGKCCYCTTRVLHSWRVTGHYRFHVKCPSDAGLKDFAGKAQTDITVDFFPGWSYSPLAPGVAPVEWIDPTSLAGYVAKERKISCNDAQTLAWAIYGVRSGSTLQRP